MYILLKNVIVYPKDLFLIADFTKKKGAAMSEFELAAAILKIIPPACQVASMIYEKAMDMHNKFKTEKNNTPGICTISSRLKRTTPLAQRHRANSRRT